MKRPKPPGPRPRIGRKATNKLTLGKPSVSDALLATLSQSGSEEPAAGTPRINSTDTAVKASSKLDIASNILETKTDSLSGVVHGINEVYGANACMQIVGSNLNALPSVADKVSGKFESFEVENKGISVVAVVLDDDRPSLDGTDPIEKTDSAPRISKVTPLAAKEGGAFNKEVDHEVKNFTGCPTKENVNTDNRPVFLAVDEENLERKRKSETDIFIFGFEGNVEEEDVRKAFQEIGEIVELRWIKDKFGEKSKGYALLRFPSAADAQKVLEKYPTVELCRRQYRTSLVESETLFLGNINAKWKTKDVIRAIKGIGIEKIDKVSLVIDPNNLDLNQGAFVKLRTHGDAEIAYKKIEETVSGELQCVIVIWLETLGNSAISQSMPADKASHAFSEKIFKNKRKAVSESSTHNDPIGIKPDQSRHKESSTRSNMKRRKQNKVFPHAAERRRDQPVWRQSPISFGTGPSNCDLPFYQYDGRLLFLGWPGDQFYIGRQMYGIPLHLNPRECYVDHGAYTHRPWIRPFACTDTRDFPHRAWMASSLSYREQGYRSIGPANNVQREDRYRGFRSHY